MRYGDAATRWSGAGRSRSQALPPSNDTCEVIAQFVQSLCPSQRVSGVVFSAWNSLCVSATTVSLLWKAQGA